MFGIIWYICIFERVCREIVVKGYEVLGFLLVFDDCVVLFYVVLLMFIISGLFKCKEEENEL